MNKYPKKINTILKESPLAYGIVTLMDFNSKNKTANDLFKKWQTDKINILKQ